MVKLTSALACDTEHNRDPDCNLDRNPEHGPDCNARRSPIRMGRQGSFRFPTTTEEQGTTRKEDLTMMNDGFVRVATASPDVRVADPKTNAQLCLKELERAAADGVKIMAFPEMTLTSYVADDLLYQDALMEATEESLQWLVAQSAQTGVLFSVGLPLCINGKTYNTLAICYEGRILGVVPKTFIPTYGVDFEGRWFEPGPAEVKPITVAGQRNVPFGSHQVFRDVLLPQLTIGYEICEDIWSPEPPSIKLALAGATVLINGSASNASLGKNKYRRGLISGQSARLLACYIYCSSGQGDSTGDITVGGQEFICENGEVLAQAKPFGEAYALADVDLESLWRARRGMSSFHVAATPEHAGYVTTQFEMELSEQKLLRPVSRTPFVADDLDDLDGDCDLAVAMMAHGLLARLQSQSVDSLVVDATSADPLDVLPALLVTAEGLKLAGLDAGCVQVVTAPSGEDCEGDKNGDGTVEQNNCIVKVADTLGFAVTSLSDIKPCQLQQQLGRPGTLLIETTDLTQLALGLANRPLGAGYRFALCSQVARTFLKPLLQRYAATCTDEPLRDLLSGIDFLDFPDELQMPSRPIVNLPETVELGPVEVMDFAIDGLLSAHRTPALTLRMAKTAFEDVYTDEQLERWMESFIHLFFASQIMRAELPDGPRLASAGLDLKDGYMLPMHASEEVWMESLKR